MTYLKLGKPSFYKDAMKFGFFPDSNKIVKFQESFNYWIFKTGQKVYKVKKKDKHHSAVSLDKIFCSEVARLVRIHSPGMEPEVLTISKADGSYRLGEHEAESLEKPYYVIAQKQLSDRFFLDSIIDKGKLTEQTMDALVEFLWRFHQETECSKSKKNFSPDALSGKLDDLFYQSKKYLNKTIKPALINMTHHPLERYLSDHKKTLAKRLKKGSIKMVHGCFIPRKINVGTEGVMSLGKSVDPLKEPFADVASDVADLTVELNFHGLEDMSLMFAEKYQKTSKDKELEALLPAYQAVKCLSQGLKHSMAMGFTQGEEEKSHQEKAAQYYELLIPIVRGLKPIKP